MHAALYQPRDCPDLDSWRDRLRSIGWTVTTCALTREIEAATPDLVISSGGSDGKRTAHPWLCLFRDDPEPLRRDRRRLESLLSHDGFLTATAAQARFITDTLSATDRTAQFLCLEDLPEGADLPERLTALVADMRRAAGFDRRADGPDTDYIVRIGGRDVGFVNRCLASLAAQTMPGLGAILVRYAPVPGLEAALAQWRPHLRRLDVIDLPPGRAPRSTALWAGLAAVRADLFGMLDDDDALHPNHVASLAPLAWDGAVAAAGSVQVWDDAGGPRAPDRAIRAEHRHFHGLPVADRARFLNDRMPIHSSAFLAPAALLASVGPDPALDFAEDTYLIRRLLRVAPLRASCRVSTDFHWRHGNADNTAFRDEGRAEAARRVADRERLDPVITALRQQGDTDDRAYAPAWGQPGGGPVLPRLCQPADFWSLPTGRPLFVYGAGAGGRIVMGELAKMPHLPVTAILDSTRRGTAFGHPLRLPTDLTRAELTDGVFIIASQYVAEMTQALTSQGAVHLFDANPHIRLYLDLLR